MKALFLYIFGIVFVIAQLVAPKVAPVQEVNPTPTKDETYDISIIRPADSTATPTAEATLNSPTAAYITNPAAPSDPTAGPAPVQPTANAFQPASPAEALFGKPAITDTFEKGSSGFGLNAGLNDDENIRILAIGEKLSLEPKKDNGWVSWRLRPPVLRDSAAEMEFSINTCARGDRAGIILRAEDYGSGYGYYIAVSCEGTVSISRNTTILASNPAGDLFLSSSGDVNVLTAIIQGSKITALLNGTEVVSADDGNFTEGFSGFFTAPQGLNTLKLDILSFKEYYKTE